MNTLEERMFRVPTDPIEPTFDSTYKVSFWEWLTSSKLQRRLWRARRDAAARLADANRRQRLRDYAAGDHGNDGDSGIWQPQRTSVDPPRAERDHTEHTEHTHWSV